MRCHCIKFSRHIDLGMGSFFTLHLFPALLELTHTMCNHDHMEVLINHTKDRWLTMLALFEESCSLTRNNHAVGTSL